MNRDDEKLLKCFFVFFFATCIFFSVKYLFISHVHFLIGWLVFFFYCCVVSSFFNIF